MAKYPDVLVRILLFEETHEFHMFLIGSGVPEKFLNLWRTMSHNIAKNLVAFGKRFFEAGDASIIDIEHVSTTPSFVHQCLLSEPFCEQFFEIPAVVPFTAR